jgi:hypothetical protein
MRVINFLNSLLQKVVHKKIKIEKKEGHQTHELFISQLAIGAETIFQTESSASARETFICIPSLVASTETSHKQVLLCFTTEASSMQQGPPCCG